MKRRIASSVLLGLLSLAAATSAPKLTLAQQAVKADVIVRATVEAPSSVEESGQMWTVYPLTIMETLAGDAQSLPKSQNKPSIWLLGGIQDGPTLPQGDTMLLLYKERYDSPLVGFSQGHYQVQNGSAPSSKVVVGLPEGTPGVAAASTDPASVDDTQAQPPVPQSPAAAPAPVIITPPTQTQPPAVEGAASENAEVPASQIPAASAPTAPSSAAAAPSPTVPSESAPASAASANSDQMPALADPAAVPNPTVPDSKVPNVKAPSALLAGQLTLEAFRQLLLNARAGAGK